MSAEKVANLTGEILKGLLPDAIMERPQKSDFNAMLEPGSYLINPETVKSNYPAGIYSYGVLIVAKGGDFTAQIYIPHRVSQGITHALAFRVYYSVSGAFSSWIALPVTSITVQS